MKNMSNETFDFFKKRMNINGSLRKDREINRLKDKILRYKNYITPNGGVTISGGEPLLQVDFLIELFEKLKKENIHTCIDTSGSVALTDKVKKLIDLTDLFLLDIKCINDDICKDLTGVSNKKELEFAKYLSDNNKKMWIRQVLIPQITDNENDLRELANYLKSLRGVEKFELLKYHDLGRFKWENLNLEYPLARYRTANEEDVKRAKEIMQLD